VQSKESSSWLARRREKSDEGEGGGDPGWGRRQWDGEGGFGGCLGWGRRKNVKLLGFFVFVFPAPFNCKIAPPLSFQPIFIGKILFRLQNWSLIFLFL
jgi:hypothetical protein